ncbi:MAG: HU family DNA-binding protein [Balneolaceae bacterium]|nr:HU family DNA-binding protein [Balneolaceae bacterium]
MTKTEALRELATQLDITQAEADKMYTAFVKGLTHLLSNNKGFTLPGLGSFHSEVRKEHKSYNPHYKKMMMLPPKRVVHFSQSTVIRDEINEEEA